MTAAAKGIGPYPIVLGRDGLEPEVLAGLDGGVVAQGTSITASFLTQATAGGFPVGDSATIGSIKGNTVVDDGALVSVDIESFVSEDADGNALSTLPITAQLRSAGSVADELTSDALVTRIGSVDLGALTWTYDSTNLRFSTDTLSYLPQTSNSSNVHTQLAGLDLIAAGATAQGVDGYTIASNKVWLRIANAQPSITTQDALVAWLAANVSEMLYQLATPTTTPQSTNLTYRCEAGGTESFVVPAGHVSAPPTVTTVYAIDTANLSASIAPSEGPKASTNYAIGDLLMLGGTLCKVTSAIATGEDILIGTNVTQTSVAAVIAAL